MNFRLLFIFAVIFYANTYYASAENFGITDPLDNYTSNTTIDANISAPIQNITINVSAPIPDITVNASMCVHEKPTIKVTPESQAGFAGETSKYFVEVFNKDNEACGSSYISTTFPNYEAESKNIYQIRTSNDFPGGIFPPINAGASQKFTMVVDVLPSTPKGTYYITMVAEHQGASRYTDAAYSNAMRPSIVVLERGKPTCTDTDDGINYHEKGVVEITDIRGIVSDAYDGCSTADKDTLQETYCMDGVASVQSYMIYKCPNGCRSGVCLGEVSYVGDHIYIVKKGDTITGYNGYSLTVNDISWADTEPKISLIFSGGGAIEPLRVGESKIFTDAAGETQLLKAYVNSINKENSNAQVTVESIKTPNKSCTDTDGGKNYYIRGTTTQEPFGSKTDYCIEHPENTKEYRYEVVEYWCDDAGDGGGQVIFGGGQYCLFGDCKDGACIKEPGSSGGTVNPPERMEQNVPINKRRVDDIATPCDGCLYEGSCLPYGIRVQIGVAKYCELTKALKEQKLDGSACQNNYECTSNFCTDGQCVNIQKELKETKGLLQTILDFLKKLFNFG